MKRLYFILVCLLVVMAAVVATINISERSLAPSNAKQSATASPSTDTTPDQSPKAPSGMAVNTDDKRPSASLLSAAGQTGTGACAGNESDDCSSGTAVDYWPSGSEASINTEYNAPADSVLKQIGGTFGSSSGNTLILVTASGREFRITFPIDTVKYWNQERAVHYNNSQVRSGSTLIVTYGEPFELHDITISAAQIYSSMLTL